MKKVIKTDQAPAAIGPYSQAIQTGDMLFISGQLGIDPSTGEMVNGGIEAQTFQVFRNIQAILSAAGYAMRDITKTTVFLESMELFAAFNAIYASHFEKNYPARSTVAVKTLPKNGLVEIDVIAIR